MAWVYILESASGRFYIGSTTDLDRRVGEHRRGHTHTTTRLGGGLNVAAALQVATLAEARSIASVLKLSVGRAAPKAFGVGRVDATCPHS